MIISSKFYISWWILSNQWKTPRPYWFQYRYAQCTLPKTQYQYKSTYSTTCVVFEVQVSIQCLITFSQNSHWISPPTTALAKKNDREIMIRCGQPVTDFVWKALFICNSLFWIAEYHKFDDIIGKCNVQGHRRKMIKSCLTQWV